MRFTPIFLLLGSVALTSLLAACGSWSPSIERTLDHLSPYKLDIPQGNVISQEMLAKLKPGMTPSQVRFVLGTPLVVDPFHKERWDYVYSLVQGGKQRELRHASIIFENDKLKSIETDVVAAGEKK